MTARAKKPKRSNPDANGKYACGCVWSLGGYWLWICREHKRVSRERGAK